MQMRGTSQQTLQSVLLRALRAEDRDLAISMMMLLTHATIMLTARLLPDGQAVLILHVTTGANSMFPAAQ
ncbi:MAG: hypothetical protein D6698_15965 [Gammaproteobacteria bacterium]|nr:MAG: hypothetical protein D6698_15965 [Gammaproteobacteria bacterium]